MTEIRDPSANAAVFALCNLLLWGCVGYFLMGQKSKGIAALVFWVVGWICTFGLLSIAVQIICAVDAYGLGMKLASGEAIGEKEHHVGLLNSLPLFN